MCKQCDINYNGKTKLVNLHVHSCYSLLDGLSKLEDIVSKVKRMGQTAFAITEHGNVFSAVKAYKLAKEHSLKHIYGIEFYITGNRSEKDASAKYNHLTVLAKNEQGRKNINMLSSLGFLEGFYYKPRIDHELLKQYKEGLIVMSGCMASEFQQALAGGKIGDDEVIVTESNIREATRVAKFYRDIFGADYYLEVQSHADKRQQALNRAIVDIATELSIPYVVTADSHFVEEEDFELHNIFIQIGTNREAGETYADTHLQCEGDARRLLKPAMTDEEIELAVRNTSIIADKCNVDIPLSAPIIPHVKVPDEFDSQAAYLKYLCNKGWKERKINIRENRQEYMDRLKFEYNAIIEMGFEGYYLLVEGYANSVKRRGIARGSGGGSLVAYLLNIVDIDPIQYGLYFERFIDVGALDLLKNGSITRKELKVPDFDLDFGRYDREIVINSIIKQHGQDKFISLGQFGYIWDKTAVKDVGKVLGVPFEVTNEITKAMDAETIEEILESGDLKRYTDTYPKLFDYAKKLAGLPKSFGIHPCGRAITTGIATDYTAIALNKETVVMQGDMHDAEDLGIVKIDALGLRTVDVIYDTLDLIGKDYDYIAPQYLNFSDEKVLEIFREGNTEGMFQFESNGMRKTLQKMKPTGLDDLGVANALFRPGSMKFIDTYVRRKNGEEEVTYTHPELEPILKVTYGIIVFQEQLIEIGRYANMRNPDLLRQATGKKDIKKLNKAKPEMEKGLKAKGWTDAQVEELWNIMLDFAKYSFNKSHSYAYGMIAYITAFLKAYHPKEFICSLFNSYVDTNQQDKFEHIMGIYKEAKRLDIQVRFPTMDEASDMCYIDEDGVLIYGLALVKGLSKGLGTRVNAMTKELPRNLHYVDFLIHLFENNSIDNSSMDLLLRLNFFKRFGSKEILMEVYHTMANNKKPDYETHPEFADVTEIIRTEKKDRKTKEVTIVEKEKTHKRPVSYSVTHKDDTKEVRTRNAHDYYAAVSAKPPKKTDAWTQLSFEREKLGYEISTWDVDDSLVVITHFENMQYTPKAFLYQLNTGRVMVAKVNKKKFWNRDEQQMLFEGDVLQVLEMEERDAWLMINDKWHQDPTRQEWHLERVKIVRKSPTRPQDIS